MDGLSILIPTHNDECLSLVKELLAQCKALDKYEIIVADDGSTDEAVMRVNGNISTLPCCTYIIRGVNSGRAAVRNFLARQAHYDRLLFVDCGRILIRKDFISKYANADTVVYGGYKVPEQPDKRHNLRYIYERACQPEHTAEKRQAHPYQNFNTCNVLIPKSVALSHPFDETFFHYGYEDVAYGIELEKSEVVIRHIDNPMGLCRFEDNPTFVGKTEESIRTLIAFRQQLQGYSRLLSIESTLNRFKISSLCRCVLSPFMPLMRRNLTGRNPSLSLFAVYKVAFTLRCMNNAKNKKNS